METFESPLSRVPALINSHFRPSYIPKILISMVLEATVIVIDNSEWMRNGDYPPTRLSAQSDAVHLLFNVKTQSNPENTVAVLTSAGAQPEVLVTLTADHGKVHAALHAVKPSGAARFATAVQIAQLVLKHRGNKNQRQRVVAFVGSPLVPDTEDVEKATADLVKLAKKLKKNNVAVDIVSFGEDARNGPLLDAFVAAANSADNGSHLVTVPAGPAILSDVLVGSPIVMGEDGDGAAAAAAFGGMAAGGGGFEYGVDPSMDPELAMALRISMEEERARQDAAAGVSSSSATGGGAGAAAADVMDVDMTEDEELQRALLLSMGDGADASAGGASGDAAAGVAADDMEGILGSLPGVDPNDPRIRDAVGKKPEDQSKKE
ncbi:hypothetical protein BC828DRAFT_375814 [Blastocladiella britannica]|nr:hypothetical protein BC828DRAFT_375814 [Blastocladiella britannica]